MLKPHGNSFLGLSRANPSVLRRLIAASTIGLLAGVITYGIQGLDNGFIDIWLAHGSARELISGHDPYNYPTEGWPPNPLPAILLMTPVACLPLKTAGAIFLGMSAFLMAYGLTSKGAWWRLWAFASFPFIFSMIVVQWSPLLFAILLLPSLYGLLLVKPHIGASIAILNFTWKRAACASSILIFSFLLDPDWLIRWISQTGGYDGFIPLMILPGPILLFSLLFRRFPQGRFLLLFCLTPQRLWYDQLLLWWIPQTRRSMLLLTACSWGIGLVYFAYLWGWIPQELRPASREAVIWSLFIPALVCLFLDKKRFLSDTSQ